MTSKRLFDRAANRLSMYFFVDCVLSSDVRGRIRVRNLSETGLGGDLSENIAIAKGQRVTICFYGTVLVEGHVAWVDGERVGICFDQRIDLAQLRLRSDGKASPHDVPRRAKPASRFWRPSVK